MSDFKAIGGRSLSVIVLCFAAIQVGCASASVEDPYRSRGARATGDQGDEVGIGYGTQDRDDLSGAVSSVRASDVERGQVTRIEDLINGRLPGVTVERRRDGSLSIQIRGNPSLLGDGEPLIVIDGFPMTSGASALAAMNPADIDRLDVLKDAGSTAIYGSRGANGVILVTTKRAR